MGISRVVALHLALFFATGFATSTSSSLSPGSSPSAALVPTTTSPSHSPGSRPFYTKDCPLPTKETLSKPPGCPFAKFAAFASLVTEEFADVETWDEGVIGRFEKAWKEASGQGETKKPGRWKRFKNWVGLGEEQEEPSIEKPSLEQNDHNVRLSSCKPAPVPPKYTVQYGARARQHAGSTGWHARAGRVGDPRRTVPEGALCWVQARSARGCAVRRKKRSEGREQNLRELNLPCVVCAV